jgi:hypothetical protein
LHVSQSANSLQLAAAPPKPHHSRVVLDDDTGAADGAAAAATAVVPSWDTSSAAISHLLHMEKALLIEEEKQTLIVNPAAVLADVGAPNRLDLVLGWRSSDGLRRGVFHAPGLACMKTAPSACSLKVLLSYPRTVGHDFARDGWLDDVGVSVRVRNTLEESCVTFSFETLPPEEEFDASKRSFRQVHSPALRSRYTWHGSTKCKVVDLAPGRSSAIQLFASFPAAGVYNLNRFRFTVEVAGRKPRVFFFPLQHLIHVTQQTQAEDAAVGAGASASAAADDSHSSSAASAASLGSAQTAQGEEHPSGSAVAAGMHHSVLESVQELEQDPVEGDAEAEADAVAAAAAAAEDGDDVAGGVAEAEQEQAADDLGQEEEDAEDDLQQQQQQQDPDESLGLA